MKKLFLFCLFIVLFDQFALSQTWRRLGGWGNQLTGIAWVNDEVGYISGDRIILKTIDGGLSWTEQDPPIKNKMLAVDFFNQNKGLMVGEEGKVFRTTNGGNSWELQNLGTSSAFTGIKFLDENKVYLVGENGSVYKSTNGGQSWTKQQVNSLTDLTSLHFSSPDTGYIAGKAGQVLRTFNGGNTWTTANTGQSKNLNDIYFVSGKKGYAVGEGGTIMRTLDAAQTWSVVNSGTERDLIGVDFNRNNPDLGVVVGSTGTLIRTVNGGLTFDGININNNQDYLSASFRGSTNVVYAVGTNGFVISSVNSGGSWSLRFSGVDNDYTGTQFNTANLGYIIGKEGKFLVTTNGGTSLVDRSRPLSITFSDLAFTTNAFGYIAGENGVILRTSNTGSNWTSLNPNKDVNINGLYFFNNTTGYAVGNQGYITKTSDSGVNWQIVSASNTAVDLRDVVFFDQENGIVIGKSGYIGRSVGGEVWEKVTVSTTVDLRALALLDAQTAIVVGDNGLILKSADKGISWEKIEVDFNQNLMAIDFLDESVGFIAGENGLMLRTLDAGKSWAKMPTGTFQDFSGISFGDLSRGYAVGEKGTLFSYSCQVPETPTLIFGENNICLSQQIYSVQNEALDGEEFEWRVDGGTILEGQGTNSVVVKWEVPGRNAVLVRGTNNCGNGSTQGLEVLVSIEPQVIPEINGEGAVCQNSLNVYSVQDIPGTEFLWELTGGLVKAGQGTSEVSIEWIGLGSQSLKVTPINPCGNGIQVVKSILVQNIPEQPSEISGPEMVAFTEEEYQVTTVPNVNFQWSLSENSGRIISGQGTSKITVLWENEGNHDLTVTPMNSCDSGASRTLQVNVNIITSIDQEEKPNFEITVFPNPSQGDILLKTSGISEIREINIVNALGQNLNRMVPSFGSFDFRFQNLPKGFHTIVIRTRDNEYYRKIIVQ